LIAAFVGVELRRLTFTSVFNYKLFRVQSKMSSPSPGKRRMDTDVVKLYAFLLILSDSDRPDNRDSQTGVFKCCIGPVGAVGHFRVRIRIISVGVSPESLQCEQVVNGADKLRHPRSAQNVVVDSRTASTRGVSSFTCRCHGTLQVTNRKVFSLS